MLNRPKLLELRIYNIGCIGPEGLSVSLDNIVCLVGPNNSGKSTVIKAYKMAHKGEPLKKEDYCLRANGAAAVVELDVHIPEGTENVGEQWKIRRGDYLIVKSQWTWESVGKKPVRKTFDPEKGVWSDDAKASGLDNVFKNRIPTPVYVGTLESYEQAYKELLPLILEPVVTQLEDKSKTGESDLKKALERYVLLASAEVEAGKERIKKAQEALQYGHGRMFPDLQIDFSLSLGSADLDIKKLLSENSGIKFKDYDDEVTVGQQGTGSQRALLWSLLELRHQIMEGLLKESSQSGDTGEGERKADGGKAETTKPFPSMMLIVDEPEIALHPSAIAAARDYLYELAESDSWQVMLATHSPAFVDPLKDHTTIVRLSRTCTQPTPTIYRADDSNFSSEQKEQLKMLNKYDYELASMFFGQVIIIVEGDTEYVCFNHIMDDDVNKYPVSKRPRIVRARGKATIPLVVKMLSHFKVPFAVIHDSDYPKSLSGKTNGAWTANEKIIESINDAVNVGCKVIHKVSIPSFEFWYEKPSSNNGLLDMPAEKDKPWNALSNLKASDQTLQKVSSILDALAGASEATANQVMNMTDIINELRSFAETHCPQDERFQI